MATLHSAPIRKQLLNVKNVTERFYHNNLFIASLLFTVLYLLSGKHSLIVCNVLTTVAPGIFTYFQMSSKTASVQDSIVLYWIICGTFFACDSVGAAIAGYSYIKMQSLLLIFSYIVQKWMENDIYGTIEYGKSKVWTGNSRMANTYASGDISLGTTECQETTLTSPKTVPRETHYPHDLNTAKLSLTKHSTTIPRSGTAAEESRTGTEEQDLSLDTAIGWTLASMTNQKEYSRTDSEGLATYPKSQVIIRSDRDGPIILAFTNNYEDPVMWALKTNAIKRLVAFPTAGILPPFQTVHVKVDLVGKMPEKSWNDRLSLEYRIIDASDSNDYNFFHHFDSTRLKKCFRVVYVH